MSHHAHQGRKIARSRTHFARQRGEEWVTLADKARAAYDAYRLARRAWATSDRTTEEGTRMALHRTRAAWEQARALAQLTPCPY